MPQNSAQKRWYRPGLRRLEPGRREPAGHDVALETERGHEEAVDDVLGGHREADRLAHGHVQLVHLAVAVGVLDLPHPLLAGDVDLDRVGGRPRDAEEDRGAPGEHDEHQAERDDGPDDLEQAGLVDVGRDLVGRPAAVLDREDDDERADQERKEGRDGDQEEVEGVDVRREARGLLRKELHQRVSPATTRRRALRRRVIRKTETASASTVAAPASRTMFRTTAPYLPVFGS